jgi:Holliday junction resolvasome RuvABC endonuclease subunit
MAAIETLGAAMAPRVLALDLSLTATGIALPNGDLQTIKPTTKGDKRLLEISRAVHDRTIGVDLAVIEDLPTHAHSAGITGMVHGAVRVALIRRDVTYLLVPPATLKVYATGVGNCPKVEMRMELYKRTGLDVPDDNQVDAAWLRLLALDLMGTPELDLPKTHRRALDKITAPVLLEATR